MARTKPFPYVGIGEIVERGQQDFERTGRSLVVVLDHLEDPQNLGSILRTVAAVGATGVVIPEDRACGVTPAE